LGVVVEMPASAPTERRDARRSIGVVVVDEEEPPLLVEEREHTEPARAALA
jgi:hypothetical protein